MYGERSRCCLAFGRGLAGTLIPHDSRTMRLVFKRWLCGSLRSPFTRAIISSVANLPISRMGCLTVVNGGSEYIANPMSSNPTTAITIVYNDGIAGHPFEFSVQCYHRDLMLQKGLHPRAIGARGHKHDSVHALLG